MVPQFRGGVSAHAYNYSGPAPKSASTEADIMQSAFEPAEPAHTASSRPLRQWDTPPGERLRAGELLLRAVFSD